MRQCAKRFGTSLCPDHESEREYTERRECQHPVDNDDHCVGNRFKEAANARPLCWLKLGYRKGKGSGEDNQRQDRVIGRRRNRVGRDHRAEEIAKRGNAALLCGHLGKGRAQRFT